MTFTVHPGELRSNSLPNLADLKDGFKLDLGELVWLTPFGRRMLAQLDEIEKAKADKKL